MRVEIARIRLPINANVLADLRVKHAAILDGVQWLAITAEVTE